MNSGSGDRSDVSLLHKLDLLPSWQCGEGENRTQELRKASLIEFKNGHCRPDNRYFSCMLSGKVICEVIAPKCGL